MSPHHTIKSITLAVLLLSCLTQAYPAVNVRSSADSLVGDSEEFLTVVLGQDREHVLAQRDLTSPESLAQRDLSSSDALALEDVISEDSAPFNVVSKNTSASLNAPAKRDSAPGTLAITLNRRHTSGNEKRSLTAFNANKMNSHLNRVFSKFNIGTRSLDANLPASDPARRLLKRDSTDAQLDVLLGPITSKAARSLVDFGNDLDADALLPRGLFTKAKTRRPVDLTGKLSKRKTVYISQDETIRLVKNPKGNHPKGAGNRTVVATNTPTWTTLAGLATSASVATPTTVASASSTSLSSYSMSSSSLASSSYSSSYSANSPSSTASSSSSTPTLSTVTQRSTKKKASVDINDSDGDDVWAATVTIGSNKQSFSINFDTGSGDFWVPSVSCTSTGCASHKKYNASESSTATAVSDSDFSISYGDSSSMSGIVYRDTVTVGGLTAHNQSLGVATTLSSDWASDTTDGIMGMGYRALSQMSAQPYFATLIDQGTVSLGRFSFKLSETKDASELYLGGMNSKLYTSGTTHWYDIASETYWNVKGKVSVNGTTVSALGTRTFILDTGTNVVIAPPAEAKKFWAAVPNSGVYGNGYYYYPCASTPDIAFAFGTSKKWSITTEQMNLGLTAEGSSNCVGAVVGFDAGVDGWILGGSFLKGVYSTYDMEGNRIGLSDLA